MIRVHSHDAIMTEPLIRSISDTARWVAYHRATESDRPDAIFKDPFARQLAGERGASIARVLHDNDWAIAVRTYLFDTAIKTLLAREPIDVVVNLAAGLDSRPYRMDLPPTLGWIEVDLPQILEEKRQILANEKPACKLEVIAANLGDVVGRKAVFTKLNTRGRNILVITEGLLIYLDNEKVSSLAADLLAQPNFRYWMAEITSPKVLEFINRKWKPYFEAANSVMSFAPADWRKFFRDRGWGVESFENLAETAVTLHRAPRMLRVFNLIGQAFPGWREKQRLVWESGLALLKRT
jgi:methyltransferase (TIGR00027 family)